MAHMMSSKGEFRRGFGKGPKRKELKPRELPGGRDVFIPLGRLRAALKSKAIAHPDEKGRDPRDPRLVPLLEKVLGEAMGKGISIHHEIGEAPACPTSVISSALSEGDRILSMGRRLDQVIGRREAKELSAALEATMPKLVGMKRLCR
jgi:hypothetical protein